ncbi:hypothetical protein [Niastella sp. OAS944]|uniref:hypothetical protein n=1 Tax=Niastella sp. OAS944 TaxID=2664089 RepID=UPI00346F0257|nr:hypothetical protein [Chitinophagaceae bacterium OAS944]
MKTLSILPMLVLLFGFTTKETNNGQHSLSQKSFKKNEIRKHAAVKLFYDPYNMQIGYNSVAHTIGFTWSTDGAVSITTMFNFESHFISTFDKHDSFVGVALQPNVSYTYWFGAKRYIFYYPGSGFECIITQAYI